LGVAAIVVLDACLRVGWAEGAAVVLDAAALNLMGKAWKRVSRGGQSKVFAEPARRGGENAASVG
jgi:hypothetical protein